MAEPIPQRPAAPRPQPTIKTAPRERDLSEPKVVRPSLKGKK
jgi:hypothetical protein